MTAGEAVVRPAKPLGYPWAAVGTASDYRQRLFMERSKLKEIAGWLGGSARGIFVEVAATVVSRNIGGM